MCELCSKEKSELRARIAELEALINSPELDDFIGGLQLESAHQTERWGKESEENSPPHHYVLVANKLLGKLSVSIFDRDTDKFKHHCITLAAAMYNAHRQIKQQGTVIHRWFDDTIVPSNGQ